MQVMNGVKFGMIATSLYWVFVVRTRVGAKTVLFSKKVPPNLSLMHKGQLITLWVIIAAVLHKASTRGQDTTADSWTKTPRKSKCSTGYASPIAYRLTSECGAQSCEFWGRHSVLHGCSWKLPLMQSKI